MQGLGVVTTENLLQRGQEPLLKLEIFVSPFWKNVSDWFSYILSACDATADWAGTALSIDNADYKEGSGSLKDTNAAPTAPNWYATTYNPTGVWDLSNNTHVLCWLKCDRPNTAFTSAQLRIYDSTGKYRYWNLTFSAGEWTAVRKLLATGDGVGGAGAPNLALITSVAVTFQAADGTAFYKKIDHLRIDDSPVGEVSGDFLESFSISFAGATMSPNPIAATLSAEINNKGAQLHPKHPTSLYTDYFQVGRKVKIAVGAKYGGNDYYWQRIIGHIDTLKFSGRTFKVSISGLDYTKTLADTKFKKTEVPPDNYWGSSKTFSTGDPLGDLGPEIYTEEDAMDEDDAGHDTVAPWDVRVNCTFVSIAATSGQSNFEGKAITTDMEARLKNPNVGNATIAEEYRVTFWYKKFAGSALPMRVSILQDIDGDEIKCGGKTWLNSTSWTKETFYFTALKTGILIMELTFEDTGQQFRIDHISIKKYDDPQFYRYDLPVGATGVHYATLDEGDGMKPVWPGKQKGEGWYYNSEDRYFYFDADKHVEEGTDNLVVYYFTEQSPENVVADLMVKAGLYADQATALLAMEEAATGFKIPQVWFDAGKSCLSAIKMLCERCDYRFYFKYDGTPVFKPFPAAKAPGNEDLVFEKQHISEPEYYEDRNEIRNRVVIEGLKQALPEGADETMPSELKGTAYNQDSIDDYGEHTLSIRNHLFQDQDSIDDMCDTLLARYKDPMWYFAFDTPFNPAPLEIWDTIKDELLLKTATIPGLKYGAFKYDSGVRYGSEDTAIDVRGLIRDIKIDKYNITYKCEEVT